MKFKFAFENVLRHRKSLEDIAQRDLQTAIFELEKEQQLLQMLYKKKSQARNFSFEKQVHSGDVQFPKQVSEFIQGQDIRIALQRAKVEKKEKEVENYREILRERAQELKIIEKLKEKKWQVFRENKNKHENKMIDDLNIMRFRKKE